MKHARTLSMLVMTLALIATTALAQLAGGGGYDLSWHTIDNGGGTSSGGQYTLSGTIGQPDAGVMTGGDYVLAGGYWTGAGDDAPIPTCPADINGSGGVDVFDLLDLLAAWGSNPGHPADINGSGAVDVFDLLDLLAAWGPCP